MYLFLTTCISKNYGGVIMSNITMDQVAVMSVQYFHYTLDYYLNSMHRCGVKNLDLWGASPHYCRLDYLTSSAAERKLREIRKRAEDLGLKFVMYTPETLAYPYSLSAPEQPIRDRTIDYFDMAIDDALTLGTTRLFMNSGCGPLDIPREDSWKRAVETISKVCEMAHKRGVTILLEQLQPYESNLLVNLPQMKAMLEEVNSPALKTCVDLVAMEVAHENLEDYYKVLGEDTIQFIHFADGDPSGHYILGDGNYPLKEYIEILEKHNYTGIIDLEINDSIYWDDPHSSVERSVDYLKKNIFK